MPSCYNCGGEIEFRYVDGRCIPFHLDGQSCFGRSGGYSGGEGYGTYSSVRSTSDGEVFEFPFITYPSYVNPNARCPVCGASVYFYQSPYGGRVFFDELGPPWPKHPCTDNPVVRHHFSSAEGRARILVTAASQSEKLDSETAQRAQATPIEPTITNAQPPRLAAWVEAGWMPFVVTKIVYPKKENVTIGIEAEGKLFVAQGSDPIICRIHQKSTNAMFYHTKGGIRFGSDLIQNSSRILSVLNESPVLLKRDPDLQHLTLSSFILTRDGEVEEISLSVVGTEIGQP